MSIALVELGYDTLQWLSGTAGDELAKTGGRGRVAMLAFVKVRERPASAGR